MHSRMVHIGKEGHQMSQPYSIHGEHINAVDRARLNEILLDKVEEWSNVSIYFGHKVLNIDFESGSMEFLQGSDQERVTRFADLIIGADGANSKVRTLINRNIRMNYQQEYIDTLYCELSMPPQFDNNNKPRFALDPNHLHIWPRHTFMLIALPNPDKSFTCTLFMPADMFDDINTETKLMNFFKEEFNDAIPLIGEKRLQSDYFANPRGSLISIKTSPHNLNDKSLIIGDAAHAMVPFYGQGMNCGFQDVQVLHEILDKRHIRPVLSNDGTHIPGLNEALNAYSKERVKDAHAICDLAMYNHYEMRSAVTSMRYLARKKLEGWIHYVLPKAITPLYSMVSFSTLPYSQAIQRWHKQTFWLNVTLGAVAFTTTSVTAWMIWRATSSSKQSLPSISSSSSTLTNSAKDATNASINAVKAIGNLGVTAGNAIGINRSTVDPIYQQTKSAFQYVFQSWK
ncbi:hypothetical protein BJ944DRAFT_161847 [Cunninghamella echinulata]|nr:hypothetical protein BJ944DRAFT_161847 [Cunninghamella echinulata]